MQNLGDTSWGVDGSGYFYLSYYDQGVSEFASYSFMKESNPEEIVCHQYDYLSSRPQYVVEDESALSAANVFDVKRDEMLTSVGVSTLADEYNIRVVYALYKLREGATSPVDGELLDTFGCLYGYPGYHRELLDEPIPLSAGERFSVVVTQTLADEGDDAVYVVCADTADTEASARAAGEDEYGRAVVNRGESWAFKDGRWQDWLDVLEGDREFDRSEKAVDNIGIKAFARTDEDEDRDPTSFPHQAGDWRGSVGAAQSSGNHCHHGGSGVPAVATTGTALGVPASVERLAGANRYATMSEVLSDAFSSSEDCIVASGSSCVDALSAAGLAGALRAPVVLTDPGALSPQAAAQIRRLGVRRALLMGGEAALSPSVADAVSVLGVEVERVAGADRAATSVEAMRRARREGSVEGTVLVASGSSFADALAAGPWAWSKAAPLLLCGADGMLGAEALAELGADPHVRRVVVLGGEDVVGDVASQLTASVACERVGGDDRYETARLVAERAMREGLSLAHVYVVSGTGYADALAAGPAAGARGGALLLADPSGSSLARILEAHRGDVRSVHVVGGEAAVRSSVVEAARRALG